MKKMKIFLCFWFLNFWFLGWNIVAGGLVLPPLAIKVFNAFNGIKGGWQIPPTCVVNFRNQKRHQIVHKPKNR